MYMYYVVDLRYVATLLDLVARPTCSNVCSLLRSRARCMRSWCGGGGGGGVVPLKVKLENYGKQREICWIKY